MRKETITWTPSSGSTRTTPRSGSAGCRTRRRLISCLLLTGVIALPAAAILAAPPTAYAGARAQNQAPQAWWPKDGAEDVPRDLHVWVKGGTVREVDGEDVPEEETPRFRLETDDGSPIPLEWDARGHLSSTHHYGYSTNMGRLIPEQPLSPGTRYRVVYRRPGVANEESGDVIVTFTTGSERAESPPPPKVADVDRVVHDDPREPELHGTTTNHGNFEATLKLSAEGPYIVRTSERNDYSWDIVTGPGKAPVNMTITDPDPGSCIELRILDMHAKKVASIDEECAESSGLCGAQPMAPPPRGPLSFALALLAGSSVVFVARRLRVRNRDRRVALEPRSRCESLVVRAPYRLM